MHLLRWLLFVAVVVALSGCKEECAVAVTGPIVVTVIDASTSAAICDASVWLVNGFTGDAGQAASTTTDDAGVCEYVVDPAESSTLTVSAPGFQSQTLSVDPNGSDCPGPVPPAVTLTVALTPS